MHLALPNRFCFFALHFHNVKLNNVQCQRGTEISFELLIHFSCAGNIFLWPVFFSSIVILLNLNLEWFTIAINDSIVIILSFRSEKERECRMQETHRNYSIFNIMKFLTVHEIVYQKCKIKIYVLCQSFSFGSLFAVPFSIFFFNKNRNDQHLN